MPTQPPTSIGIITDDTIDESAIRAAVERPASGAVVLFAGVVRNHDDGRVVRALDYQAHPEAERILQQCCDEVAAETGLSVAAAHRVGSLIIGDVALYAAVSAPHRAEAFRTVELLVERIKATVPIWKRQHFPDDSAEWVGL